VGFVIIIRSICETVSVLLLYQTELWLSCRWSSIVACLFASWLKNLFWSIVFGKIMMIWNQRNRKRKI